MNLFWILLCSKNGNKPIAIKGSSYVLGPKLWRTASYALRAIEWTPVGREGLRHWARRLQMLSCSGSEELFLSDIASSRRWSQLLKSAHCLFFSKSLRRETSSLRKFSKCCGKYHIPWCLIPSIKSNMLANYMILIFILALPSNVLDQSPTNIVNQLKNLGMYRWIPCFWSSTDTSTPCARMCSITNCSYDTSIRLNSASTHKYVAWLTSDSASCKCSPPSKSNYSLDR